MQQYIITLEQEDLSILDAALSQMPYRSVVALINKINIQIASQQTKKDETI